MSAETARTEAYRRDDPVERSELTDPVRIPEDDRSPDEEASLRPRTLDEFVGQPELREHITITLQAAIARSQPPDHLLFAGPPGLGKTTLAGIIAAELGAALHITSGPAIERAGDLAAMLTNLADGDVLFIDEIHRLPKVVEEVLYPAMEDFAIDIVLGKGPAARSIRFDLPRFTLVGATTRTGLISGPLRDRFGLVERLDYYSADDLAAIVRRAASILGVRIDSEGGAEIATRSRGTPRIANRLLRRVRDYAEVRANGVVDTAVAKAGLAAFGVDDRGLDKVDRAVLEALAITHAGQPLGLSTLSIMVGEQAETVEDVYEPFLIQQGLVQRTPRGRIATAAAYAHLGVAVPLSLESLAEPRDERFEATLFGQASSLPETNAAPGGEPVSGALAGGEPVSGALAGGEPVSGALAGGELESQPPDRSPQVPVAKSESQAKRPQTDETPW